MIGVGAGLGAASGFGLVNTAPFGECTCLWGADAAARLSCVLRPGAVSCSGSGLSRKRERQRSSSPRPLAFSGETRCRGRSPGARAGAMLRVGTLVVIVQRAVSASVLDPRVVPSPMSRGWKSARWKKLRSRQSRAALDAMFEHALVAIHSMCLC